jgi:hypothetical protein
MPAAVTEYQRQSLYSGISEKIVTSAEKNHEKVNASFNWPSFYFQLRIRSARAQLEEIAGYRFLS